MRFETRFDRIHYFTVRPNVEGSSIRTDDGCIAALAVWSTYSITMPFVPPLAHPGVWISMQRINAAIACVQHTINRHSEDSVPIRTNNGCSLHITVRVK